MHPIVVHFYLVLKRGSWLFISMMIYDPFFSFSVYRLSFQGCVFENVFSNFCGLSRVCSYTYSLWHLFVIMFLSHLIVALWLPLIFHLSILYLLSLSLSPFSFFRCLYLSSFLSWSLWFSLSFFLYRSTSYPAKWAGGGGKGWQPILCPFDNWRQQGWLHL